MNEVTELQSDIDVFPCQILLTPAEAAWFDFPDEFPRSRVKKVKGKVLTIWGVDKKGDFVADVSPLFDPRGTESRTGSGEVNTEGHFVPCEGRGEGPGAAPHPSTTPGYLYCKGGPDSYFNGEGDNHLISFATWVAPLRFKELTVRGLNKRYGRPWIWEPKNPYNSRSRDGVVEPVQSQIYQIRVAARVRLAQERKKTSVEEEVSSLSQAIETIQNSGPLTPFARGVRNAIEEIARRLSELEDRGEAA